MSDRNYWTQSRDHIAIIGHRGARALYPENTMVSFEKAVEMEVDGIETDVHMTTDGQLVLHHDDLLDRTTTGSGPIEAYSYKELMEFDAGVKFSPKYAGEKIPRLEEFLDLVQNTDLLLNVEMKDYRPEALRKTIETLDRYGLRDRYVIASFSATVTTMAHKLYGVKTQGFPLYMVKYLIAETELHYYAVGIGMQDVTRELTDSYLARGIEPWCWCADTEEAVQQGIDGGVTMITANDPRPALKVLRGKTADE